MIAVGEVLVGIKYLLLPDPEASLFVNTGFVVFPELELYEIVRKICYLFGREVSELEEGIRPSLVDPISPNIDLVLPLGGTEEGQ